MQAEHARNAGTIEVDIQKTDMGVLARQLSLEIIPICLLAVYAGLLGFYLIAARPGSSTWT